jgi:hypothetical protein
MAWPLYNFIILFSLFSNNKDRFIRSVCCLSVRFGVYQIALLTVSTYIRLCMDHLVGFMSVWVCMWCPYYQYVYPSGCVCLLAFLTVYPSGCVWDHLADCISVYVCMRSPGWLYIRLGVYKITLLTVCPSGCMRSPCWLYVRVVVYEITLLTVYPSGCLWDHLLTVYPFGRVWDHR